MDQPIASIPAMSGHTVHIFTGEDFNPAPVLIQAMWDEGRQMVCIDLGPQAVRLLADTLQEIAATLPATSNPNPPKPDAEPAAYTCEDCMEETADGWTLRLDAADGPWIPTCWDCRERQA